MYGVTIFIWIAAIVGFLSLSLLMIGGIVAHHESNVAILGGFAGIVAILLILVMPISAIVCLTAHSNYVATRGAESYLTQEYNLRAITDISLTQETISYVRADGEVCTSNIVYNDVTGKYVIAEETEYCKSSN